MALFPGIGPRTRFEKVVFQLSIWELNGNFSGQTPKGPAILVHDQGFRARGGQGYHCRNKCQTKTSEERFGLNVPKIGTPLPLATALFNSKIFPSSGFDISPTGASLPAWRSTSRTAPSYAPWVRWLNYPMSRAKEGVQQRVIVGAQPVKLKVARERRQARR